MSPTFGSLFAGVGGFDLGFEAAGWTPKWQVEWDARCQSVLARRWPELDRYGDVHNVIGGVCDSEHGDRQERRGRSPGEGLEPDSHVHPGLFRAARHRDLLEPVDCITYGFPCQDLSVAGRRAGLDGDRSNLFFEAVRIIKEMRDATDGRYPRFAVAENVPGLLSADRGAAMGRCLDALADIGAVGIEWAVLDAQHFGVPQRRRRVFIVAWFDPRIGGGGPLLPVGESCTRDFATFKKKGQAVAALTACGVGTCGADDNQGQAGHLIPTITDPSRLDDQATGQPIPAWVKVVRSGARDANGDLPAEVWREESVAPTLNAFDNGSESRATVLPFGVRRLTPRECERLMGWPDDHTRWAAEGTQIADTNRYRMCGNGVVAPVAEWIATRLREFL